MRAISALAAEIPPKPKIAATTEIIKNIKAHLSNVMNVPCDGEDRSDYSNSVISTSFQEKNRAEAQTRPNGSHSDATAKMVAASMAGIAL
jgi:hypothetical protein